MLRLVFCPSVTLAAILFTATTPIASEISRCTRDALCQFYYADKYWSQLLHPVKNAQFLILIFNDHFYIVTLAAILFTATASIASRISRCTAVLELNMQRTIKELLLKHKRPELLFSVANCRDAIANCEDAIVKIVKVQPALKWDRRYLHKKVEFHVK